MSISKLLLWLSGAFALLSFLTSLCLVLPKLVAIPLCLSALCAFVGAFLNCNVSTGKERK